MGYFVKNRRLQSGSSGVVLPTGSASQRPLAPVFGMIRYNTDVPGIEYFNGSSWLYLADNSGSNFVVQTFTGDGSTSTFTLKDRKSTRLNSSHIPLSRMPSSA